MTDRIKEAVLAEAKAAQDVAHDVARSGAYLYPFKVPPTSLPPSTTQRQANNGAKGLIYFATHKSLWRPFLSRASQTITLGLGVTTGMFFFTYVPQMTLMLFTSGPLLAPFSAALLVLSESSTITTFLSRSFVLGDALTDTFDGTLVSCGCETLVAQGRHVAAAGGGEGGGDAIARLGKMVRKPLARLRPRALLRSLLLLPVNFVPVVGTLVYVFVQGRRFGPVAHERYFQLKGWGEKKREEWLRRFQGAYTGYVARSRFLLVGLCWWRRADCAGWEWRRSCWRWCLLLRWCLRLRILLGRRCGRRIWRRRCSERLKYMSVRRGLCSNKSMKNERLHNTIH